MSTVPLTFHSAIQASSQSANTIPAAINPTPPASATSRPKGSSFSAPTTSAIAATQTSPMPPATTSTVMSPMQQPMQKMPWHSGPLDSHVVSRKPSRPLSASRSSVPLTVPLPEGIRDLPAALRADEVHVLAVDVRVDDSRCDRWMDVDHLDLDPSLAW